MQLLRLAYPDANNIEVGSHCVWPAGPAPATGGVAGLFSDLPLWKRFLQFGDASVGDLGANEDELPELRQPFEGHQPCVADFGFFEPEPLQVGQCAVYS